MNECYFGWHHRTLVMGGRGGWWWWLPGVATTPLPLAIKYGTKKMLVRLNCPILIDFSLVQCWLSPRWSNFDWVLAGPILIEFLMVQFWLSPRWSNFDWVIDGPILIELSMVQFWLSSRSSLDVQCAGLQLQCKKCCLSHDSLCLIPSL